MESEHTSKNTINAARPFDMFIISEAIVDEIRNHQATPHRHNYEELLIITKGKPSHFIDFMEEETPAPVVIYVPQGKIHEFKPDLQTRGWCIRYSNEFIPESNFHYYSNYIDQITFAFDEGDCRQKIGILCELLLHEFLNHPENANVCRYLLSALLSKLEAEGKHHLPHDYEARAPRQMAFRNFLKILEDNFKRSEGVAFYADKLNTSVRNLNLLCNQVFGQSVSEIIETRKIIEARRYLLNTAMTVSEIGFALGYNEKSYFTRVFRKRTGLTPTDFRAIVRTTIS
jgi:AraC-like DNA-binding protein